MLSAGKVRKILDGICLLLEPRELDEQQTEID